MVMPQGCDILLPMDRILQMIQQDLPDGPGVIRVRMSGGIGDHRNLGRMSSIPARNPAISSRITAMMGEWKAMLTRNWAFQ